MAYSDFTLENVEQRLGLTLLPGNLFPNLVGVTPPTWLVDVIARNRTHFPLVNEKSRSEVYVAPILTAAAEMGVGPITIFSGHRLDADAPRGLVGECDFIVARTPPLPRLRAPVLTVVEAKKADIELGLAQCVAQMEGAMLFNRAAEINLPIFGCVTSGEVWQFLRRDDTAISIDDRRYFATELGLLLAALRKTLE